jgi:NifU-like protein involved in Fe-S cluster formation
MRRPLHGVEIDTLLVHFPERRELALPPVKIHCSILAEDAIRAAVADYKAKHVEAPAEPALRAAD